MSIRKSISKANPSYSGTTISLCQVARDLGLGSPYSLRALISRCLSTNSLFPNMTLNLEDSMSFPYDNYKLKMEKDGNLVLYWPNYSEVETPNWASALWATNTNGKSVSKAIMQEDGNFVLYTADNKPIWSTGTYGHSGSKFDLQSNGNLVVYDPTGRALWDSGTYELVFMPTADLQQAKKALIDFRNSSKRGAWRHIDKINLIEDIRLKLVNPYFVNQRKAPFCGPASIIFELVRRNPTKYVQICRSLFETGEFQGRTKTVNPSQSLKDSTLRSDISVADWMLMATLRDVENALYSVVSSSFSFVGITTPWEMKGWIYELLDFNNTNYDSTMSWGEFDAIRTADAALWKKGVAFLNIHSAMVGHPEPTVAYPDHWVPYMRGLSISKGDTHVRFRTYSWGELRYVDLDEGPFEDYMFGVVLGTP